MLIFVKNLVPISSKHLCKSEFSTMLVIEIKSRNKCCSENDKRCVL